MKRNLEKLNIITAFVWMGWLYFIPGNRKLPDEDVNNWGAIPLSKEQLKLIYERIL